MGLLEIKFKLLCLRHNTRAIKPRGCWHYIMGNYLVYYQSEVFNLHKQDQKIDVSYRILEVFMGQIGLGSD